MSKSLLSKKELQSLEERQTLALQEISEIDPDYQKYLEKLPARRRERIHRQVAKTRNGLYTIAPTTCVGPSKCLFIEQCPIPDRGPGGEIVLGDLKDYPMYRPCVFEMLYMQQKVIDYMQHLGVDPENPIEMALVNDLAVIDLYKNRAMLIMAGGDKEGDGRDFMKRDMMEQQGEHGTLTSTQTQLHPAATYLDTLEKRRSRLLEGLQETRKGKMDVAIKLGQGGKDSALREELILIKKALEAAVSIPQAGAKDEQLLLIDDD
jgi:hypothetical protein